MNEDKKIELIFFVLGIIISIVGLINIIIRPSLLEVAVLLLGIKMINDTSVRLK
ncbi:hypothetical protein [Mycoplasma sp. P36-A1]|uniref:hypothetical protein n=1 Tax=Mycoplasma sp. P36-A1 TaxID=3252900 RepID=UPI003C2DDB91